MNRRSVLRGVGVGIAVTCAGCMGGEVVHDVQRQVRIEPGRYWMTRIPSVGGAGAISYTVRAEQRFDLFVFTRARDYERYVRYHQNGTASEAPTGRSDLSTTAVGTSSGDQYAARTGDGGAREPFQTDHESVFVVDHSNYGVGASPGDAAEPLHATVDLEVVEKRLAL